MKARDDSETSGRDRLGERKRVCGSSRVLVRVCAYVCVYACVCVCACVSRNYIHASDIILRVVSLTSSLIFCEYTCFIR